MISARHSIRQVFKPITVLFAALVLFICAPVANAAITFVGTSIQAFGGGAVTSLSFTPPAAAAVGDVMLVQITVRGGTGVTTMTPPAGWSVAAARVDRGTTLMQIIYYRVRTASETASYTWNFTSGRAAGVLVVYRGADTTAPINASGGQANASSTSVTAPSITTTVTGTTLVGFFATANAGTSITPPCSPLPCMNGRYNNQSGAGPNGLAIEVSDATQAAAGATGTRVASSGATAAENIGHLIALKAAVAVTNPGRFNTFESSTAAGAIAGPIYTKLAGTAFSLDIVALNLAKTAVLTTFTGAVKVELLNASNNAGTVDTNNCNANWTTIQTLATNPTFVAADNGRKTVSFTENNAWPEVRVRVTYPATGVATAIGCSTDNFSIRPTAFTSVTSSMTNTGASGTPKARAGLDPFTLTAATGLTGYNGTPQIDPNGMQAHSGAVQTGTIVGSFPAAVSGTSTGTNAFTYSEVGNFRFLGSTPTVGDVTPRGVYDSDFTSVDQANGECTNDYSNTLSGGMYGCYFGITANTSYFGRFYPASFVLSSPVFLDRNDITVCGQQTTGSMAAGGTTLTVGLAAGISVGDTLIVRGAGSGGANLQAEVTAIAGTTITLDTAAGTGVAGASVYKLGTTGTVAASSTVLTVVSATGFSVGDPIVVSGAGSTAAGSTADLVTTVSAVSGTTITLGAAATTAVTNATVYKPGFSYQDEPMSLGFVVSAYNGLAIPSVTQNYTGTWAGGSVSLQAENNNNGTSLGSRLTASVAPSWSNGVYTFNDSNLRFARNATPDGPYDSLQIGVTVSDPDAVVLSGRNMNPVTATDCIVAGNCTGVAVANTRLRFGQLRLSNAHGSELLSLPVAAETQYWNGAVFITNTADSCTALSTGNISLAKNPVSCTSALGANASFALGRATMTLSAPNAVCRVDMTVNLGTAAENKTYLQGKWSGSAYNQNPTARATFGVYKSGPVIYLREIH